MRSNYVTPNTQTILFSEPLNAKATIKIKFSLPFLLVSRLHLLFTFIVKKFHLSISLHPLNSNSNLQTQSLTFSFFFSLYELISQSLLKHLPFYEINRNRDKYSSTENCMMASKVMILNTIIVLIPDPCSCSNYKTIL
jgi:hypothetical protein